MRVYLCENKQQVLAFSDSLAFIHVLKDKSGFKDEVVCLVLFVVKKCHKYTLQVFEF